MAGLVPAIHAMRLDDRFGQETRHRRRVDARGSAGMTRP